MRHTHPNGNASIISISSPSSPSPSSPSPSSPSRFSQSLTSLPFQHLDCYQVAKQLAAIAHRAGIADPELRDQTTRAAKSAFLNLSEGLPSDRAAVRRRYFAQADGSVHEVAAAVDLASEIGVLDAAIAAEMQQLARRLRDMLRGLMRPNARTR
jgi:four helix bundle protein